MFSSIPPKIYQSPYRPRFPVSWQGAIYCALLLIIIIGIFLWQKKLTAIKSESDQQISQSQSQFWQNLKSSLEKSDQNAFQLVINGRKHLDKNLDDLALLYFERAAQLDKNYRDAALYTGYTYLKLAQNSNYYRLTSNDYYNKALNALLTSRDLDPLYKFTHQLLAYTYDKLGDSANSQASLKKAQFLDVIDDRR